MSLRILVLSHLWWLGMPALLFGEIALELGSLPIRKGQAGWRYWSEANAPEEAWRAIDFDDAAWAQGEAPMGYGEDAVKTEISYGDDPQSKYPAAYFRLAFEVDDPNAFAVWDTQLRCDDGAVVYLNGKEVYRYNMPKGDLQKATFAAGKLSSAGNRESRYHRFLVEPGELAQGANLLAVSVHQADAGSSDLVMDFSMEGMKERVVAPAMRPLAERGLIDDDAIGDYITAWGHYHLLHDRAPSPNQWPEQLQPKKLAVDIDALPAPEGLLTAEEVYKRCAPGVLVISGMGEGEDAEAYHAGGFIISTSGLALTNHHVIQSYSQGDVILATTYDGRVVPVREVLASSEADDVALIQLEGENFHPLPLATESPAGSELIAITHPRGCFYTLTQGQVARQCLHKERPRIMVTTEFALGSSGAPILNRFGAVVGMVEMTQSIAYNTVPLHEKEGALQLGNGGREDRRNLFLSMNHQMTLRFAVPSYSLRAFLLGERADD